MRPLFGVVTSVGRTLVIRTESGQLLRTTDDSGFSKYDKVAVFYDHTRNRIVRVEHHSNDEEAFEFDDESELAELVDEVEEDEPPDPLEDEDSGALLPCFGEEWDPEEGVLRMEGDSSIE